jgi:hypothetical protein
MTFTLSFGDTACVFTPSVNVANAPVPDSSVYFVFDLSVNTVPGASDDNGMCLYLPPDP